MRRTTSIEFRNIVQEYIPAIETDNQWRFLQYLLFPREVDKDGNVIIRYQTLQTIAKHNVKAHDFHSGAFLLEMKQTILPELAWSDYSYIEERARIITHHGIPQEIMIALAKERKELHNIIGQVYFETGLRVSKQRKTEQRMQDKTEAMEYMYMVGCRDAKILLDYMNNLPANRFSLFTRHLHEAMEIAQSIEHEPTRNRQIDILRSIAVQPQPFYKPTSKTVRVSSSNDSVLRLRKDIRKALTKGLVYVDLHAAQMAIAARVWNIPSIQALLEKDEHLWNYLLCAIGAEYEVKPILKQTIYAIMFGMSEKVLIHGNYRFDGLETLLKPYAIAPRSVLDVDIVKDIIIARRNVYGQIAEDMGAYDKYGTFLYINDSNSVNSIAAQVIQSWELYLMAPIVHAAQLTQQFTIMLWLHDGCYIHVRDMRNFEYWKERINYAVMDNALRENIYTQLVFEH